MSLARTVGASLSFAVLVVLGLYPLLVYAAIGRFGPSSVAVVLAAVCLARIVLVKLRGGTALGGRYVTLVCFGGVLLAVASFLLDAAVAVLYYPVLVNAALLVVFAASLARPPSVIERFARLREPDLPPTAVAYTRRVTIAWAVFFALNGAAAFYTAAFTSLEVWSLYNGLIAYALIGTMFGIELAIRSVVQARLKP